MAVGLGVNDFSIVGEPIAFGAGFIALLFVCFSTYIGFYFYAYAAAGGPLLVFVALAQYIEGFWLYSGPSAVVGNEVRGGTDAWAIRVLRSFSRYAAPPLLGLAGAALIASGNPWAVLLAATILSILALLVAKNALAFTIPLLVVLGLGAALLYGSAEQQAFAATFVVWFLLIAGTIQTFNIPPDKGSTDVLPRLTLIPSAVWVLLWFFVALVALIIGGQLLLRPGHGMG